MIGISDPAQTIDPTLAQRPGAFFWWYLDLVDAQGDGLVLIWSLNLPFLPDVSYAVRAGGLPLPAAHPSLNLVVHRDGKPAFYLLQQGNAEDWAWDPAAESWRLGDSRLRFARAADGRARLQAELDLPIPHSAHRLTGTIDVQGHLRQAGDSLDLGSEHRWCPLVVAARGQASLRWGDDGVELRGRAYLDRNACPRPITDLGIDSWSWGRLPLPGRELIWYRLEAQGPGKASRHIVLEVDAEGRTRRSADPTIHLHGRRRGAYGLLHPRGLHFTDPDGQQVDVQFRHRVEDGPFYQRFVVLASVGPHRVEGVAEELRPDRIALPLLRPLIEMRVHKVAGPNSMWLPLFSGSRQHRPARLMAPLSGPREAR